MKKLTIQQICDIYPKDEYMREGNTFIKGNCRSNCTDQIIEEHDDCWITLAHPIEIVGEVLSTTVTHSDFWKGYYPSNIVHVNVLYNVIKPATYFMHHQPQLMEAAMYKGNPVIKALFRFSSVIITEVEEVELSNKLTVLRTCKK